MLALRLWLALMAVAIVASAAACKKSAGKSGAGAFTLKGAPEVITALDQKDHAAAVRGLAEVKASLTPEQREEYRRLLDKVVEVLVQRMAADESAAKAYQALRLLEAGR